MTIETAGRLALIARIVICKTFIILFTVGIVFNVDK